MATIESMNDQFAVPGAKVIAATGNLPAIHVHTKAAHALIYLHGAHVVEWKPAGQEEVLWLSEKSHYASGKPIRGGVPICFPWFGPKADDATAPAHGFVRLAEWAIESITAAGEDVIVVLAFASTEETKKAWNADFTLRHRIVVGKTLTMTLELTNTGGAGGGAITAQEALHTYFGVGDVRKVKISGLEAVDYLDKTDGAKRKTQEGAITITAETDRVYLNTVSTVTVHDPVKRRRISIAKENSKATVVWNPWIAKAKAMPDFGDEEWPGMVCVETCNVGEAAVTLAAGATHGMTARISVEAAE